MKNAFDRFDEYYDDLPCETPSYSQLDAEQMRLIKEEFKKIGGTISIYPPAGWKGKSRPYISDWLGAKNCW